MGTGTRAPRAIGTEHAGHEGRERALGANGAARSRAGHGTPPAPSPPAAARAPAVAGPSAGAAIGTADGMMGRARTAVGRRRATPPLATARIKGPGAAARAFNGLRGGLPRRRLPKRLKGDGGRGRARPGETHLARGAEAR